MHCHSRYSDSFTTVKNMIKKAEKEKFGFALTDHNTVLGCRIKSKKILLISGMEFSSKEGPHILTYFNNFKEGREFYEKVVKNNKRKNPYSATKLSAYDYVEKAEEFNAVMSFAHPFAPSQMGIIKSIKRNFVKEDLLKKVNGIEVVCGSLTKKMNEKAIEYSLTNNSLITGGSDAHTLKQLGRVQTFAKVSTSAEFLEQLRKKQVSIIGKEFKISGRASTSLTVVPKNLRYFFPTLKLKYESLVKKPSSYYWQRVKESPRRLKDEN